MKIMIITMFLSATHAFQQFQLSLPVSLHYIICNNIKHNAISEDLCIEAKVYIAALKQYARWQWQNGQFSRSTIVSP